MEMLIQNNVSGSGGGVKNKTLIKNTIVAAEPTIPLTDKPGFEELAAGITQLNQLRLSQINNLNATITNLTTIKNNLESQIAGLQSDKNGLQTQVSNLQSSVGNLQNQVNNLNNNVSSLTTQRNNLQNQVNSLNTTVTNLTNEKNSLTTQRNNLQTQVNSLNTSVTNLTNEKNSLSTSLTTERNYVWNTLRSYTGYNGSSSIQESKLTSALNGMTCYQCIRGIYNNGTCTQSSYARYCYKKFQPIVFFVEIQSSTGVTEYCIAYYKNGSWSCYNGGSYYTITINSSNGIRYFWSSGGSDTFSTMEHAFGLPG